MNRHSEIPGSMPGEYSTARFWVWANDGPVKLSIQPGDTLTHTEGGPNEEGYSYTQEAWTNLGDVVERITNTNGQDCDGHLNQEWLDECAIEPESLFSNPYGHRFDPEEPAILFPDWRSKGASVYDENAQRAGY